MDPGFVERHWDALPNLRRLRDGGRFSRLATTTPPQSPVAWSTFITGLAPAEHGIYDFVHRDPTTLQPFSSLSRIEEPRFRISLFDYAFQFSSPTITSLRKGTPFWETISKAGVPVQIFRMPTNYPPVRAGNEIAGMGVPDLQGTLGTFSFFTDDPAESPRQVPGGRIVQVAVKKGQALLPILGPPNTFRTDRRNATAALVVDVDPQKSVARLTSGGTFAVVQQGEWSDWLAIDFPLIPHGSWLGASVRGTFRVYIKQLHPTLSIYVSPINVDPLAPALPVSYPATWSRDVAREIGRFYTLGIPEDTSALRQNVFTFVEFQHQTELVADEEHRLLRYSLRHFQSGLLFFYLSSVDQASHIYWGRYEADLLDIYRRVDREIGEVTQAFPKADLIIMSDHGFTSFDRAVHLNTWLKDKGFLGFRPTPEQAERTLEDVNWASTEAYAIGLNGLYLNQKGRERDGVVSSREQRNMLIANLREQLTSWRDPLNGRQIVEVVADNPVVPKNASVAPDLIVGYAPGYRASWQTALGGAPDAELSNNDDQWIGDHCINPADVPGVFFSNRASSSSNLRLQDVTHLILQRFGIER